MRSPATPAKTVTAARVTCKATEAGSPTGPVTVRAARASGPPYPL